MSEIRLLIADDHKVVLNGLHSVFDGENGFKIIGEAYDGQELVEKALQYRPDVIISDHKMPRKSGVEAAFIIKAQIPQAKVIIFSGFSEEDEVQSAIDAKVDGYILKDTMPEELINAVELVYKGYSCIYSPEGDRTLVGRKKYSVQLESEELTEREIEIYRLIARNYSNKEIAQKLFITEATVKSHISRILRKTGQPNRAQAVVYGLSKGLFNMNDLNNRDEELSEIGG